MHRCHGDFQFVLINPGAKEICSLNDELIVISTVIIKHRQQKVFGTETDSQGMGRDCSHQMYFVPQRLSRPLN